MLEINIGCDDIMALSRLIRPTGCLKALTIGDKDMPPECVELTIKMVLLPSSLEELDIYSVNLTPESCNTFSLLAENCNLTRLCLPYFHISSDQVTSFLDSLQKNHTPKCLRLHPNLKICFPQTGLDSRVEWDNV